MSIKTTHKPKANDKYAIIDCTLYTKVSKKKFNNFVPKRKNKFLNAEPKKAFDNGYQRLF